MIDLDELQSVRDRERQTDKLQQLRESFYADAGEFIQGLRDQRERAAERADDPFDSTEVNRLTDEIDTAEQTVEAIYEKRVGKIVKAASFAAADLPAGSEGMTREEQQLFETLVEDIKQNRQHVLDVLDGKNPDVAGNGDTARPEPSPPEADVDGESSVSAADVMGQTAPETVPVEDTSEDTGRVGETEEPSDSGSEPLDVGAPRGRTDGSGMADSRGEERADTGSVVERETVRITADVGAIFGVDEREYDLAEDDVVQLPAENAGPLLDSDAAERL
jgi:DNA replication factor GINS